MQEENSLLIISHESFCEKLLAEIYKNKAVNVFDFTAGFIAVEQKEFEEYKSLAELLVKEKLADFSDKEHTSLSITNYGKYWVVKGGYLSYLREGHNIKEHTPEKQHSKEELLEARLKLTHFRLIGFWLTIVISTIGFALSLFNLYMILNARK